jgi:hypothetical protein
MSPLRIVGVVVALVLGAFVLRALSRRAPTLADGVGLFVSFLLLLVALDPAVMNLPTVLLRLSSTPRGRLLALLVLSNLALWCLFIWSREQRRRTLEDVNRLFEALLERMQPVDAQEPFGEVAVVIPAYNEEESVGAVLDGIPAEVGGLTVSTVVVADGCVDRTAQVAREHGAVVLDLPVNRGGGAAIRMGYNYASRRGARFVVTMDADGQHRPEDLPNLIGPLLRDEADFVIGSRRLGSFEHVTSLRTFGLSFFNFLLNVLLATDLSDCSSGYRAFAVAKLPRLLTTESQYHTAETIMEVWRRGLRIAEVPVAVRRRLAGESRKGSDLLYGYRFARVLFSKWIRG